jgi:hypothetical protein
VAGSNPATPTMITYLITSIICTAGLFFYNIKKRFTVKITYVLLFLITYGLLVNAMHDKGDSNIYFGILFAFPALFVSMMFTPILSEPLTAFHEGIKIVLELVLEYKVYAAIVAVIAILIYYFS